MKLLAVLLLLVLFASTTAEGRIVGDSSSHGDGFGASVEAYELRPGFLLTVSRDAKGQPKDMVVEKAAIAGRSITRETFTERLATIFVDELAPPGMRGAAMHAGDEISCFTSCSETQEYENVTVTQLYRDFDPTKERTRLVLLWHAHKSVAR